MRGSLLMVCQGRRHQHTLIKCSCALVTIGFAVQLSRGARGIPPGTGSGGLVARQAPSRRRPSASASRAL
jgi:hypothetical protein